PVTPNSAPPQDDSPDETPPGELWGRARDSITLVRSDPNHRMAGIAFFGRDGIEIPVAGDESSGYSDNEYLTFQFAEKLPAGVTIQITLATKKAIVETPFVFRDVSLP